MSFTVPFFCASVTIVRLEGQLGQLKFLRQSVQNPIPVVVAVHAPPFLFGKMNASGDGLGHRCFQSPRSLASSFGTCTDPKLFRVLPQGRILPLYTVSTIRMVHSVWLKHCQRSANSSPGRSAFVMSSSKRTRSLRSSFESAPRNCHQVKVVRSVSRS